MAKASIGGQALKSLFRAGGENLAQNLELINQLNVFPVPDGDTGTNMYHTLQRAYREIETINSDDVSHVAERFAYGALMGARGNSGTILSQLLNGFAYGLADATTLTTERLAAACAAAVERGYASVSEPTEGTILTVAREASEALRRSDSETESLSDMLKTLIDAARVSLSNTPDLLPMLRDAGVVDAGGMGLLCFLEGMLTGRSRPPALSDQPAIPLASLAGQAASFGYDVQFLMIGAALNVDETRRDLEQLGWSVIVVGDGEKIKVHIHVDNPAIPLDYAIQAGAALDDIVVENMDIQYRQRELSARSRQVGRDMKAPDVAVIAVVEGDGLSAVFQDLNCSAIIPGGAGRNPATEDFVAKIKQGPSERVIILPNDRNITLAAQQAADLVDSGQAHVVATETVLQGIGAMLAYGDALDAGADIETMASQMRAAGGAIRSIEIVRASRATRLRGLEIKQNDFIALLDGMICAASTDLKRVVLDAFTELNPSDLELATVYFGADLTERESDQLIRCLTMSIKGLEFESVYGGQSLYPLLISVE